MHKKPLPVSQKKPLDSSTEVNFTLDEPRRTVGFKCNKKLWDAFVDYSKHEYGSVCHILEPVILAILTSKVNLSRTMKDAQQPIVIENLNVQRVVRRIRRIGKESFEETYQDVVQIGKRGICHDCKTTYGVSPYIASGNQRVFLCGSCVKRWLSEHRIRVEEW